jgi:hypothetical protein
MRTCTIRSMLIADSLCTGPVTLRERGRAGDRMDVSVRDEAKTLHSFVLSSNSLIIHLSVRQSLCCVSAHLSVSVNLPVTVCLST